MYEPACYMLTAEQRKRIKELAAKRGGASESSVVRDLLGEALERASRTAAR